MNTWQVDQLTVEAYPSADALARAAADAAAAIIDAAIRARGSARVILATGNSQLVFLEALLTLPVDWARVTAFHLDEYIGLGADHPASFRRYLRERVFTRVTFGAVHLLDGDALYPQAECARYADLLRAAPIDLACVGVGENGHLAFNDPPADFTTSAWVHVVALDEACRLQQVGEGHFTGLDAVPTHALSMSVPGILATEAILCITPEARKAEAVRHVLREPISPLCPASALRTHANTRLLLDPESAALAQA